MHKKGIALSAPALTFFIVWQLRHISSLNPKKTDESVLVPVSSKFIEKVTDRVYGRS
jgi:hypothetical protein